MKEYLLSFWDKFKNGSILKKILYIFIILLYITIICVCLIKVKVDSTIPGTITSVNSVIDIDSKNDEGKIYTVSVYSQNKMSYLQYLLVKMDKNSDVSLGASVSAKIFTENEEYTSNYGYKMQSIQDSIIVAYTEALKNGYDVKLDYCYKGQYLINIPQNLFKTGGDDFKNQDIIIGYNNKNFFSKEDYLISLDEIFSSIIYNEKSIKQLKDEGSLEIFDNNGNKINDNIILIGNLYRFFEDKKIENSFKIIRSGEEKEITPSIKMLFYLYTNKFSKIEDDGEYIYTITENNFTHYDINYDNCIPKINISTSTTVGPSGGLMQTLAVYNAITEDDVTKGMKIMGTGGIDLNGNATNIGGEQQKVVVANLYQASIFFVPEYNYNSAKEMYDKLNEPTYKLVSVKTFSDVLNYLNKEGNNG